MVYPEFPSSIRKPSYGGENADEYPEYDSVVIKSEADGGYVNTRSRYTRTQMGHSYHWPVMTDAEYAVFKAFVNNTIRMAGIFVWTDPVTGTKSNVRLTAKPTESHPSYNRHTVKITIREV